MKNKVLYLSLSILLIVSIIQAYFIWQLHKKDSLMEIHETNSSYLRHSSLVNKHSKSFDPKKEMDRIQSEMNRLFRDNLVHSTLDSSSNSFPKNVFEPQADIINKNQYYIARIDLPGTQKEDIHIEMNENLLEIKGERRRDFPETEDQNSFYRIERNYGSFSKSLQIPGPIDPVKTTASYQNGVLTITLVKKTSSNNPSQTRKKIYIQ